MFTTCAKMLVFSAVIEVLSAISINTGQKGCSVLEMKCPEPEGPCIPIHSMCDGQSDCKDGWDEREENCPECYGFQCGNDTCVPTAWVCDGEDDCDGGLDEKVQCPPCRRCSGLEMCLPMDWVCDGIPDCDDKSDEEVCNINGELSEPGNKMTLFEPCDGIRCPTGFCATYNMHTCNGINDCGDWSDERGCPCAEGMIDCGRCIPAEWWCDQFPDCPYDDDEKNCTTSTQAIPPEYTRNGGNPFVLVTPAGISPKTDRLLQRSRDRLSPDLEKKLVRKKLIKSRTSLAPKKRSSQS